MMMSSEKFISLYDYLGRPAGSALGKEVVEAASKLKIPMQIRHVSTARYTGPIMLYPENWLIGYFSTGQTNYGL
jgi:hypothetical protein